MDVEQRPHLWSRRRQGRRAAQEWPRPTQVRRRVMSTCLGSMMGKAAQERETTLEGTKTQKRFEQSLLDWSRAKVSAECRNHAGRVYTAVADMVSFPISRLTGVVWLMTPNLVIGPILLAWVSWPLPAGGATTDAVAIYYAWKKSPRGPCTKIFTVQYKVARLCKPHRSCCSLSSLCRFVHDRPA